MTSLRRLIRPLLALATACLAACNTIPLEQREWVAVETDHFSFLSDAGPEASLELAREFEGFHAFMLALTGQTDFRATVPTQVFVLSDRATYRAFGSRNTAGFFSAGSDENFVVVGEFRDLSATTVAFHEYSHFLMRSAGLFGYPIWFDEGHADFVSTVRIRDGNVELGRAPKDRVEALRILGAMPLRRVIAGDNFSNWIEEDVARLYALGWLFVHYLYFARENGEAVRWEQKNRFLSLVNEGSPIESAFEQAFGATFDAMERELRGYARNPSPGLLIPAKVFGIVDAEAREVPISRGEVARRLADLALRTRKVSAAARMLERTRATLGEDAQTLASLAQVRRAQGQVDEALSLFERAISLDGDDAGIRTKYGNALLSLVIQRGPDVAVRPTSLAGTDLGRERVEGARAEFRRAITLAPDAPEAHTELAFSYLVPGASAEAGLEPARRAFELLPSDVTVALQLAEVLIATGNGAESISILTRVRPYVARSATFVSYVDRLLDQVRTRSSELRVP